MALLLGMKCGLGMEPPNQLHNAAVYGNLDQLRLLLAQGFRVNDPDLRGFTPLYRATESAVIRCLLEAGATIDVRDYIGRTPLHYAVQRGNSELAKILLEIGVDPNICGDECRGATPLHSAAESAQCDMIELLIDYGADLEYITLDNFIGSPLNNAVLDFENEKGKEAIEMLLSYGADINGKLEISPLDSAIIGNQEELVRLLAMYGATTHHIEALARFFRYPLLNAIAREDDDKAVLELNRQFEFDECEELLDGFLIAAARGNQRVVCCVLENHNLDIDELLDGARRAFLRNHLSMTQLLLQKISENFKSPNDQEKIHRLKNSLLKIAIMLRNHQAIEWLLHENVSFDKSLEWLGRILNNQHLRPELRDEYQAINDRILVARHDLHLLYEMATDRDGLINRLPTDIINIIGRFVVG